MSREHIVRQEFVKPTVTSEGAKQSKLTRQSPSRHPLLRLQQTIGNRAVGRLLQAKLTISEPGDEYEREADQIAEQVMRMPDSAMRVQQQRACCEAEPEPECERCQLKRSFLQRQAPNSAELSAAPPIVREVLRSPGQPLDPFTRAFMESRFRHDFGHVRLHTDAKAAESAQAVNALAYTAGQDIVFGTNRYDAGTHAGRKLLAHELIHTIQQGDAPMSALQSLHVSDLMSVEEVEAERAASVIASGRAYVVQAQSKVQVARKEAKAVIYSAAVDNLKRIVEALSELDPTAGYGNFYKAYGILNEIEPKNLQLTLLLLESQGYLDELALEGRAEQYAKPWVLTSLRTYQHVFQLAKREGAQEELIKETAEGVSKLPLEEQVWIVEFLDKNQPNLARALIGALEPSVEREVEKLRRWKQAMRDYQSLRDSGVLSQQEISQVESAISIAESAIRKVENDPGGSGLAVQVSGASTLVLSGLLADDASGIGVADDVLIPFVILVGIFAGTVAFRGTYERIVEAEQAIEIVLETLEEIVKNRLPQSQIRGKSIPVGPSPVPTSPPIPVSPPVPMPPRRRPPRCNYPTGLTKDDPIPLTWFKPKHDMFYPKWVVLMDGVLDREDPDATLPDGTPVGVQEEWWPKEEKLLRRIKQPRIGEAEKFIRKLAQFGYDWKYEKTSPDHVQDIYWNGPDEFGNLWPYEKSTNADAGPRQNAWQRISFCETLRGPAHINQRLMDVDTLIDKRWFKIIRIIKP